MDETLLAKIVFVLYYGISNVCIPSYICYIETCLKYADVTITGSTSSKHYAHLVPLC